VPLPYRLLALDLDGTLLDGKLEISPRDRAAVLAARAAGVAIVLASGRMFRSSLPYAQDLGVTAPIIAYQGAVVRDPTSRQLLFCQELSLPVARDVIAWAEARGYHVNSYADDEVYTERASPEADLYQHVSGVPYHVVGPLSRFLQRDTTKLVLVFLDPDVIPGVLRELQAYVGELATVTRSHEHFVEVVSPSVDKGRALAFVADHLGVPAEQVIAVGDNLNDISMVSYAGLGVAMRHSPPALLEVAKYVASSPEEGGVADVIDRFVLGRST
jgi:Cof subfamily protein (haloacid dehalogenase superfamily)